VADGFCFGGDDVIGLSINNFQQQGWIMHRTSSPMISSVVATFKHHYKVVVARVSGVCFASKVPTLPIFLMRDV